MSVNKGLTKMNVCEEVPVELVVNGRKLLTFMCTPQYLKELAVGYLYNRGLIAELDDILTLAACEDLKMVNIKTNTALSEEEYSLTSVLASGCGSNSSLTSDFTQKEKNTSDLIASLTSLKELAVRMFKKTVIYKETGGVHCATLVNQDKLLVLREDVGRHNAIDKVIGKGLFLGTDFSQSIIITTGRISSDMVLKAIGAGIPIVVSRSIPSSLALKIAKEMGITIIGRIVSKQSIIYTCSERIKGDQQDFMYHECG